MLYLILYMVKSDKLLGFFLLNKDSDKLVKGLDVMWFGVRFLKYLKLMLEIIKYCLILFF